MTCDSWCASRSPQDAFRSPPEVTGGHPVVRGGHIRGIPDRPHLAAVGVIRGPRRSSWRSGPMSAPFTRCLARLSDGVWQERGPVAAGLLAGPPACRLVGLLAGRRARRPVGRPASPPCSLAQPSSRTAHTLVADSTATPSWWDGGNGAGSPGRSPAGSKSLPPFYHVLITHLSLK